MHYDEFEAVLRRMIDTWGKTHFDGEKKKAYWRITKNMEPDFFNQAIDEAIDSCQFAPTPAKFKEFVYKVTLHKIDDIRKRLFESGKRCVLCDNTGMVSTIKKFKPHQKHNYAFRCTQCTCADQIGLDKKGDIKRWDPRMHPKDYFPVTPGTKYIPDFSLSVAQNEELRVGEQFIRAELKKKVNNRQYTHTWLLEQFRNLKKEVLNGK